MTRTRSRSRNCEPERQEYAAADAAYDKAKAASDHCRGEWEHWLSEYNEAKQALDNRLGRPDRLLGYPEGPDGDQAYADDLAHWEAQEEAAERAEDTIDAQALAEAEAAMNEANAALDAARERLEAAQVALRDCQGSAPPAPAEPEAPPAAPASPGDVTPPGIVIPTPEPPETGCEEGSLDVRSEEGMEGEEFTVIAGDVMFNVDPGVAAWNRFRGGRNPVTPAALLALTETEILELFPSVSEERRVTVSWSIPVRVVSLECARIWRCTGGRWVKTDPLQKNEIATDSVETGRESVTDVAEVRRAFKEVKERVAQLQQALADATAWQCD